MKRGVVFNYMLAFFLLSFSFHNFYANGGNGGRGGDSICGRAGDGGDGRNSFSGKAGRYGEDGEDGKDGQNGGNGGNGGAGWFRGGNGGNGGNAVDSSDSKPELPNQDIDGIEYSTLKEMCRQVIFTSISQFYDPLDKACLASCKKIISTYLIQIGIPAARMIWQEYESVKWKYPDILKI